MLFNEWQNLSEVESAKVNNKFSVLFYPFLDNTRGNSVRIQVIIKADKEKIKKIFTLSKSVDKNSCCQISNKAGVSFNIPIEDVKDIYSFVQEVENHWKAGKSISIFSKPNISVSEFAEKYFVNEFIEKQPSEKSRIDKLLEYWRNYKIKDVYKKQIEEFINKFLNEYAESTTRKYCLILRAIFDLSIEIGYISSNPFFKIKLPSNEPKNETSAIPYEVLPGLFEKLKSKNNILYEYCLLLYYTGLRPIDVLNLTFENVILLQNIKVFRLRESKLKKYRRITIVPIHPEIERLILRDRTEGYIFEFETSRKSIKHRMSDLFKTVAQDYVPYQFRHTFPTELSKYDENETHINFLQGKLPEGTMKRYLKRDIQRMYEAICKLPIVSK